MNEYILRNILITTGIGFFMVLIILSLIYLNNRVMVIYQNDYEISVPITSENSFSQTFTYTGDNAFLVFLRLNNSEYKNQDKFTFQLKEREIVLSEINISGQNIGYNDLVKFQFPPVYDLNNKQLTLVLTSDTTQADQAVMLYTNKSGEAAIKIYAKGNFIQTINTKSADFFNRLISDQVFLFGYVFLLFIFGYLILRYSKGEK